MIQGHETGKRDVTRCLRCCFEILDIHSRHPVVRQIVYFAQRISPSMTKAAVKSVVRLCVECQSIDEHQCTEGKED